MFSSSFWISLPVDVTVQSSAYEIIFTVLKQSQSVFLKWTKVFFLGMRKSESLATSRMIGMWSELRAISACQVKAATRSGLTTDTSGKLRQLGTIRVEWFSLIVQKSTPSICVEMISSLVWQPKSENQFSWWALNSPENLMITNQQEIKWRFVARAAACGRRDVYIYDLNLTISGSNGIAGVNRSLECLAAGSWQTDALQKPIPPPLFFARSWRTSWYEADCCRLFLLVSLVSWRAAIRIPFFSI